MASNWSTRERSGSAIAQPSPQTEAPRNSERLQGRFGIDLGPRCDSGHVLGHSAIEFGRRQRCRGFRILDRREPRNGDLFSAVVVV
jgi:hypothetical protein